MSLHNVRSDDAALQLFYDPEASTIVLRSGGDARAIAQAISRVIRRRPPAATAVPRVRGATKAFSFHWSNAQVAWHVMPVTSFPWDTDGAEFVLQVLAGAASPLDRPWTLVEMQYVAKALAPHPGFEDSSEVVIQGPRNRMQASRIAERFLVRGTR